MPSRTHVTDISREQFAAGWRLAPPRAGDAFRLAPRPEGDPADIVVDILRPRDLVALTATISGCMLMSGDDRPTTVLCGADAAGILHVEYGYQHAHETAVYEKPQKKPATIPNELGGPPVKDPDSPTSDGTLSVPVGYRPARASRLVFEIPAGEEFEFSTAGILSAIGRLKPVLHRLGAPGGSAPEPYSPPGGSAFLGPFIELGEGIVARLTATGAVVGAANAAQRTASVAETTIAGAIYAADRRRAARVQLTTSTPALDRGVDVAAVVGGLGDLIPPRIGPIRRRGSFSEPPTAEETAIEAPFRLVLSPTEEARWAHSILPVPSADAENHIELWHSRLATAPTGSDVLPDELNDNRRVVRAVWARDRDELPPSGWRDPQADQKPGPLSTPKAGDDDPFRGSLNRADRHRIVRQSSETWRGDVDGSTLAPVPVGAKALWLSSLGAWLDVHGAWTTKPYSVNGIASLLAWDHVAPMGRDQFVRVVYPGYLYPLGHQTALVKITERKMKSAGPSVAGLYQRKFLVIGEPVRLYEDEHEFPFSRIELRPTVTPNIDDPGDLQDRFFWPQIATDDFQFIVDALDRDLRRVVFQTPLLWVAEHMTKPVDRAAVDTEYDANANRVIGVAGQKIAFAKKAPGGDAIAETEVIRLRGKAEIGVSKPRLSSADIVIPAVQHLSGTPPITITYNPVYRSVGFGGAQNSGELWADVLLARTAAHTAIDPIAALPKMEFGTPTRGSDKAGGFVAPSLPIEGISRLTGTVGDTAGMATQKFDPAAFLGAAAPKLFGLISLAELVTAVTGELSKVPNVISETLDRIGQLLADLARAKAAAEDAVAEAKRMVANAQNTTTEFLARAEKARTDADAALTALAPLVDSVPALITSLGGKTEAEVAAAFDDPATGIRPALVSAIDGLRMLAPQLPPLARNRIDSITGVLSGVLAATDLISDVWRFVNSMSPSSMQVSFRYEWKPTMKSWPSPDPKKVVLELQPDSFVLAVEGRASGKGEVGVQVLAELRDFTLHLLPGAPLVVVPFEHMSFKGGSSGKPEVDVVLGEIEFVGLLSFVEVIKDLIPFDGFSDPPFLDVSPSGLSAGFTLALPSVSIGVFTLANMSLGADVQVPFLGKSVTVGFAFCSRERPFTLAVVFLGGGGWFGVRISPDGLDVLELGLEAGACLAVDFGVASGSISAMIGIYIRLEGDKGSLTGYFRLRGEVDVLGLISASIELYMELTYHFKTGKMIGRATITVQVKVFVFSGKVSISAERQFAGSNGDPSFREVMVAPDGSAPDWATYCSAFASEND